MAKQPIKLLDDPIVESVFEIRFQPAVESLGELLPGLLFNNFSKKFPKIESLPLAQIPSELLKNDPKLMYTASRQLVGDHYILMIGNRVLTLSGGKPYEGWPKFQAEILSLVDFVKGTNLIQSVERFSIKYTNAIPYRNRDEKLSSLSLNATLGPFNLTQIGFQLRTEFERDGFINILNIVPEASIVPRNSRNAIEGLLIDIDTIYQSKNPLIWEKLPKLLEDAHDTVKSIFYSIVTKDTIEFLRPVWK